MHTGISDSDDDTQLFDDDEDLNLERDSFLEESEENLHFSQLQISEVERSNIGMVKIMLHGNNLFRILNLHQNTFIE